MSMDLSHVNTVAVAIGAALWAAAMAAIWQFAPRSSAARRETDFLAWKHLNAKPGASFSEFLASEQAPRIYLSRIELSAAVTALALLALLFASRAWNVWR